MLFEFYSRRLRIARDLDSVFSRISYSERNVNGLVHPAIVAVCSFYQFFGP